MSIPNDPLRSGNVFRQPQVADYDYPENEVDYVSRAKLFSIISGLIALLSIGLPMLLRLVEFHPAGVVNYLFPISFSFSYLTFKSSTQASAKGYSTGYARYVASIPLVITLGFAVYLGAAIAGDTSGWGGFAVMLIGLMMLPSTLVAILVGFFINRHLKKKDQFHNPVESPRSVMISVFRVLAVLSFIPALYFGQWVVAIFMMQNS